MRNPSSIGSSQVADSCYQCKVMMHKGLIQFLATSSIVAKSLTVIGSKRDKTKKIRICLLLATEYHFLIVTLFVLMLYIGSKLLLLSCYWEVV